MSLPTTLGTYFQKNFIEKSYNLQVLEIVKFVLKSSCYIPPYATLAPVDLEEE